MARPSSFDRGTSFAIFSSEFPGEQHNGADLDAEFNLVKISLDETLAFLEGITEADGTLKRGSVGRAQLASDLVIGISPPAPWEASTAYVADEDVVFHENVLYVCLTSHTSGLTFAASKWTELADFSTVHAIADGSLENEKFADGSVDERVLADNAVTRAKIESDAINNDKLDDDAVDARVLADGSVSTAKIEDDAVSVDKVNTTVWGTGDVKLTLKAAADAGWVMFNDGTIGNGSSFATTRANADCEALFLLLWNNVSDTYAPVSTGRGANAAADWNANKTIALTKALGRALAIAGSGSGLSARSLGQTTGTETHTLTEAQMPSHTHVLTDPGHTHDIDMDYGTGTAGGTRDVSRTDGVDGQQTLTSDSETTGITLANTGGGSAHPNMQPTVFLNAMVKL